MHEFDLPKSDPRLTAGTPNQISSAPRPSAAEPRPLVCNPDAVSFYISAGDQDLLQQVRTHMQLSGQIGIADTAGRLHYIIDGSRGMPYAARRILEAAARSHVSKNSRFGDIQRLLPEAIAMVLDRYCIRLELKGRVFLEYILQELAMDERKLKPLSKTLYPDVAIHFKSRSSQVERDIRYAFSCAAESRPWPDKLGSGNTARISYLCSEVLRELRRMNQDKLLQKDGEVGGANAQTGEANAQTGEPFSKADGSPRLAYELAGPGGQMPLAGAGSFPQVNAPS